MCSNYKLSRLSGGLVSLPFINIGEWGVTTLTDLMHRYVQSSKSFDLSQMGLDLSLTFYTGPGTAQGPPSGLDNRSKLEKLKWFRSRNDVVDAPEILRQPGDLMCLPYALILGSIFATGGVEAVRKSRRAYGRLRERALALCRKANLEPNIPMGRDELAAFSQVDTLRNFRITAFNDRGDKWFDSGVVGRTAGDVYVVICVEHFFMVRFGTRIEN